MAKKESELRMYAFFVLYFLREQGGLSGYDLAKAIRDRTRGYFSSTPGNIYPALKDLEKEGMVRPGASVGGRKRIVYKITPKGKTVLADLAGSYKERFEKITSFFDKVLRDFR